MCLLERPARAYVDPGSGILACQAVGALFTGTIYYLRQRIKGLFRALSRSRENAEEIRPGHHADPTRKARHPEEMGHRAEEIGRHSERSSESQ
jgi:hypothetical protein